MSVLRQIEKDVLPALLTQPDIWQSLFVDYEPPFVERLWTPVLFEGESYRLFLHRIHPANLSECLFHPHPWPSAIRILDGSYLMTCGYGEGMEPPPVAQTLLLTAGAEYEMVHPDGWHAVCPQGQPSHSLMLTAKPWTRERHKPMKPQRGLTPEEAGRLFTHFQALYLKR